MSTMTEQARYLAFRHAGQGYLFELSYCREIKITDRVSPAEGVPGYVIGIANIRGDVVTVLDLARLLRDDHEQEDGATAGSVLIVLRGATSRIAVAVDEVLDVLELAPERFDRVPDHFEHNEGALIAVARVENETFSLIDCRSLMQGPGTESNG